MKIQKLILPAAMSFAGLVSFGAQAANTTAGIEIKNKASLTYNVNGAPQAEVEALNNFIVDAKIDLLVEEQGATVEASTPYDIDSNGTNYYRVGVFQVSNTGNIKTVYDLSIANLASGETVNSVADTKDATAVTGFRYFTTNDFSAEIAASDALTIAAAPDLSNGTVQELYVYAPAAVMVGIDEDRFAFELTVTPKSVIEATADGSGEKAAKLIADYTAPASGEEMANIELVQIKVSHSARDIIQLAFPDFGPDPDGSNDPNKNGFIKTSVVLWDPINFASNPKAIPGATVQYRITLTNLGATNASDVKISDEIPTNTTFCDSTYSNNGDAELCANVTTVSTSTVTTADVSTLRDIPADTGPALVGTNIEAVFDIVEPKDTSTITFTVKID